jgi:DNA-binding NtrC family response regulator
MQELREAVRRVAPVPSPVLILGESGSGKELVAREIHARSGRTKGRFLPVNCAALPEHLVESELFGHERGAFTGATGTRKGAFETAHGGTLFLDEVGELPLGAQAKLLRVLEDNQVTRVGSVRPVSLDTRVVAATNRDLDLETENGRFRRDLLFRLNVHAIQVPALRERLSDVPLLVEHFLKVIPERFGIRAPRMSQEAMKGLKAYGWEKNNVRELRNIVERMILATDGPEIGLEAVPGEIATAAGSGAAATVGRSAGSAEATDDLPRTLKDRKALAEREIVLEALERNRWQITKTAAELGLADHSSLLKIMRRHGLKRR